MSTMIGNLESVERLTKDMRIAAAALGDDEARFLVDMYYQIQKFRIAFAGQVRSITDEPTYILTWCGETMERLEKETFYWLDQYTKKRPMGVWARGICGIGPVLAAGLLAHIDIKKAPTVGHIWRFAGLDPTTKWERKQKRPYNADLKLLCWKIGESFVKVSGNDSDIYGKLYLKRKEREQAKNEAGDYKDQADIALAVKKFGKSTEAYKHYSAGKLSPAHIHARAKRWSVKLFLAHWHEAAYLDEFGKAAPLPYPIAHQGHAHKI